MGFVGCRKLPNGSSMDRRQAMQVSDAFIFDLQNDRLDDALNLMEPEFLRSIGSERAKALARYVFEYCGRPRQIALERDETGAALYADGPAKPLRKFFYSSSTATARCTFTVEVVPASGSFKVGRFGSLKPTE
jgi:hypothetical protein